MQELEKTDSGKGLSIPLLVKKGQGWCNKRKFHLRIWPNV